MDKNNKARFMVIKLKWYKQCIQAERGSLELVRASSKLPPGVYFCSMTTGSCHISAMMIIFR